MSVNIAICDDEDIQVRYICKLLKKYNDLNIHTFSSAEEFLFKYEDFNDFNILLLDIEMKEINGIELAKVIREKKDNVAIIFVTGFHDYMVQGYDVEALHYLIKPLNEEKFYEVMDKAIAKLAVIDKYLLLKIEDSVSKIKLNDILYIEAISHYCNVVTSNETLQVRISLSDIEKKLDNSFIHTHRSFIVNINYIKAILKDDIVLEFDKRVPVSRRMYKEVNNRFIEFYKNKGLNT